MFTYSQSTGRMMQGDALIGTGYAGIGSGKNNPHAQEIHNVGPLPRGMWRIVRWFDSEHFGPVVAQLEPEAGTVTYGRSGFLIHADAPAHPGMASHGCIVLPRATRQAMRASGETELQVVE